MGTPNIGLPREKVADFCSRWRIRELSQDGETEGVAGLDDVTTYYLLHRHDFGMNDAPAGPCILYAVLPMAPWRTSSIF